MMMMYLIEKIERPNGRTPQKLIYPVMLINATRNNIQTGSQHKAFYYTLQKKIHSTRNSLNLRKTTTLDILCLCRFSIYSLAQKFIRATAPKP